MENANIITEVPQLTEPRLEESDVADQRNGIEAPQKVAAQKVARRRTKTGCLTCRQRRIKCGEEKPICKNCTKSKRECKGYAQRLIFKHPLGIPGIPAPIPAQSLPLPSQYEGEIDFQLTSAGTHGPILAPKLPTISELEPIPPRQLPSGISPDFHNADAAFAKQFSVPAQTLLPEPPPSYRQADFSGSYHQQRLQSSHDYPQYQAGGPRSSQHEGEAWAAQGSGTIYTPQPTQNIYALNPTPTPPEATLTAYEPREHQRGSTHNRILSPVSLSSQFDYGDEEDDDLYDVETDEEAEEQVSMQNFNQLSLVMASANRDERQLRSFTTYLNEPNVLASYQPTFGSSPLNNPKTARIFLHFIHATGPSLSVFERHPIDPSTMLGAPVPMAQQGLWTYTLPLKAFEHQALQQAILALGSLHIAYLQDAPVTVSLKHYQYALKRVGKAVSLPTRRKQLGTLAATLLLAYYEVMTADHIKWNNHLAGAAQLVREIDFAGITRDLRAQRRRQWLERSNPQSFFGDAYIFNNSSLSDDPFAESESDIDEHMIGCMTGRVVNYDQFGQVEGEHSRSQNRHLTRKDVETFRIQCDLYWWYCKQDWLQSIISGGALFLPYSQWGQCPPRAGIGRLDAIYGTVDHLTLLMGRLADFSERDRKRKLKAIKATGSEWKPDARFGRFMGRFVPRPAHPGQAGSNTAFGPPPGAAGPPPPPVGSGPQSNVSSRKGSQESQRGNMGPQQPASNSSGPPPGNPPMYGMVPSSGPRGLPSAFVINTSGGDDSSGSTEWDNDISYEEAENEWESMFAAFEAFGQSLGPDYMPLPSDSTLPIHSPFGPALQYRTHNMGSLWGFYYTGRILLQRVHPSMPPMMMVAAGVAASTTAKYAQICGQIAAGIYGPQSHHIGAEGFSPTLGSCLIEVTVPLFFAGVQYMDSVQRDWVITVLRDISRLTGWKSSDAIARGCERAWMAAAKQGRGPPYEHAEQCRAQQPPGWRFYTAPETNTERRFVTINKPPYLSWAMGILSLEDQI
ncbi:hypothetical protein BDW59DRAFT_137925 [Aspergillus cavernicola]|uniref:Zn(2)-C6 fungal-type domain-containing protein n=1 Tax=Aspergillus cavernicola TaxID=176166 RepID=A0ABR4J357_9EURO